MGNCDSPSITAAEVVLEEQPNNKNQQTNSQHPSIFACCGNAKNSLFASDEVTWYEINV